MKRPLISIIALIYLTFIPQIFKTNHTNAQPSNQESSQQQPPTTIEPIILEPLEISVLPPGPNTYSPGYCTWYVANKRWVPGGLGNANTWYSRAQSRGLVVSDVPAKGAIAWASYIGGLGHVAYVEEVYEDGTALISEMNMRGRYSFSKRVISPSQGWRFIY